MNGVKDMSHVSQSQTQQRTAFQDVTLIPKLWKGKERSDIEVTPKFKQVRTLPGDSFN